MTLGAWSQSTRADTADATCEIRKEGEAKQGASGPCTFSQREGYIDLDLRNGDRYSLSPGNNVVRTLSGGGSEEFKWQGGKKINVTFVAGRAASNPAPAAYNTRTPRDPSRATRSTVPGTTSRRDIA